MNVVVKAIQNLGIAADHAHLGSLALVAKALASILSGLSSRQKTELEKKLLTKQLDALERLIVPPTDSDIGKYGRKRRPVEAAAYHPATKRRVMGLKGTAAKKTLRRGLLGRATKKRRKPAPKRRRA